MSGNTTERRALAMLKTFEQAGKRVVSVSVDGRKIEVKFLEEKNTDEFDGLDMRHGQT